MLAEVISIGDELTSGQRLDTNSQWISERLGELGVTVRYHSTVADDLAANVRVFREAANRAEIVIASGGLGPTADDLTREALAEVSGQPLELDEGVLEHIRALFAFFKRDMPERNRVQALFPRGSRVIPNPNGTAPGIIVDIPRAGQTPSRVYALPGVPAELFEMWRQTVADDVRKLAGATQVIRHHRLKVFGAGESHVEQMLPDLIRRGREPSVGITVSGATITLRITARGATPEACTEAMQPTIRTIHECLGELVFGEEDDELEHAVMRLLVREKRTLAVAEWGTGGLASHWLDEVPAGHEQFLGGVVVGTAAAAERMLGVPAEVLAASGPVSAAVVAAMADGCRQRLGADLALAISELPRATSTAGNEAPRVYLALATPERVIGRSIPFAGHPSIHKSRTAKAGLNLVRLALLRSKSLDDGEPRT